MREYGKFTIRPVELLDGSRPAPFTHPDPEAAAQRRKLLCRRYGDCLTYAASLAWPSFHCGACDVEDRMSPQEQRDDIDGLTALLQAINIGGRAG